MKLTHEFNMWYIYSTCSGVVLSNQDEENAYNLNLKVPYHKTNVHTSILFSHLNVTSQKVHQWIYIDWKNTTLTEHSLQN